MRNITVVYDGKEIEIDCDDPLHNDVRVYRDVFHSLSFYVGGDDVGQGKMLTRNNAIVSLDDEINFNEDHLRLYVKNKQHLVTVTHDAKVTHLNLPAGATLQALKDQYREKEGEDLTCELSIKGDKLDDLGPPVVPLDDDSEERIEVVGMISVIVIDKEVTVEDTALSVYEFTTIAQLKEQYCDRARRELMTGAEILDNDRELDGNSTVYESGIRHGSYVVFKGCSFTIRVEELGDSSEREELVVYDHWTVEKIKAEYSKRADEGLVDGDKLVFNDQELNENSQIYKYRMKENSLVLVDREDFSQQQFLYQCVDCGSEVRLKKEDMIKCRSCGYRIVYKVRTQEPSQYMAR